MSNVVFQNNSDVCYGKTSKKISYVLPWIQWLHVYAFISGVTLGYALIVIVDTFLFVRLFKTNGGKIDTNKEGIWILYLFLAYMLISLSFIGLTSYGLRPISILNRLVKLLCLYGLITASNSELIDWQSYKKSLKILSYFACFVLLVQVGMKAITGVYYNLNIPFLKFANEDTALRINDSFSDGRPRSIFTEPAHFVFFVTQYLIILLFENQETSWKEILAAVFISISIILSISSTGVVLLFLLWTLFIFTMWRSGRITNRNLFLSFVAVVLMALGIYLIINNTTLNFAVYRLTDSYERSAVVWKRVDANLDDVRAMTGIFRWIGYGVGNIDSEFMNSYVYGFLCFGVGGMAIAFIWLINTFKYTKKCGRIALIVMVLLGTIDLVFYTPTALGYFVIINHSKLMTINKGLRGFAE